MLKKQHTMLSFDESNPTVIFGIVSIASCYELAHFINKCLELSLTRMKDFVSSKKISEKNSSFAKSLFEDLGENFNKEVSHPIYFYEDDFNSFFFFFQNKIDGNVVFNKGCRYDYLLIINNVSLELTNSILMKLKKIKQIDGVVILDKDKLPQWNFFIDDLALNICES